MYEDKETWLDSPRTTGLVLLAVLLSPLGGPMLFTLTFVVCSGTQALSITASSRTQWGTTSERWP